MAVEAASLALIDMVCSATNTIEERWSQGCSNRTTYVLRPGYGVAAKHYTYHRLRLSLPQRTHQHSQSLAQCSSS